MDFKFDIYVDYPVLPDGSPGEGNEWIKRFCRYLTLALKRFIHHDISVQCRDDLKEDRMADGESFIRSNSAILVSVLSHDSINLPGAADYFNQICQPLSERKSSDGFTLGNRIFKALLTPVSSDNMPECLADAATYNFFEINKFSKKAKTFDISETSGPDEKCWAKLIDLAYDIQLVLNGVGSGIGQLPQQRFIYLAETTPDQAENRDEIRRELQFLGYKVLPLSNLPNDAGRIEFIINECLNESILSVHVMGAQYGDLVRNSKYTLIDLQNRIVSAYIEKNSMEQAAFQRIIWVPDDLKLNDQRQSLYLNRLKRDEAYKGTEIIESPLEVLKSILGEKLHQFDNASVKKHSGKSVYFIYENGDYGKLETIRKRLSNSGISIFESDDVSEVRGSLTWHKDCIREAEAVVIYSRMGASTWLLTKVQDLLKAPGFGKERPFSALAIVSGEDIDHRIQGMLSKQAAIFYAGVGEGVSEDFYKRIAEKVYV